MAGGVLSKRRRQKAEEGPEQGWADLGKWELGGACRECGQVSRTQENQGQSVPAQEDLA
jgi:hypothetical protein